MKPKKLFVGLFLLAICMLPTSLSAQSEERIEDYLEAANQGNAEAQCKVGVCYLLAKGGVEQNLVEANRWLLMAANNGNAEATRWYAAYQEEVVKNLAEANKWYMKAAEMGDAVATRSFGINLLNGKGVDKNPIEALKLFQKAAEMGDAKAAFICGIILQDGKEGLDKNPSEANKWYIKAAEMGDAMAAYSYGKNLEKGIGVDKNPAEANKWYIKAAEMGYAHAARCYGWNLEKGIGVEENLAEAHKWYMKAAEMGDPYGAAMLGSNYFNGIGVSKNLEEAKKWYLKAKKMGYDPVEQINSYINEVDAEIEKESSGSKEYGEIKTNFTIAKNILGTVYNDKYIAAPEAPSGKANKATLECIDMGTMGKTIILDQDIPVIKQKDPKLSTTYSWSGSEIRLFRQIENGHTQYIVLRGQTPCGGLMQNEDGWICFISTAAGSRTISGIKKGMSRLAVENECSSLGFSKFKYAGTSGGLKIYTLQWLDMKKRYNFYGTNYHYEMNNNKEYARFYFNAQDKLVKWILF